MNLSARVPTPSFSIAMSTAAAANNTRATTTHAAAHTAVNTAFISVSSPTSKATTNNSGSNGSKAPVAAPLRLQLLEETLANVSMVEAPTSFSPSNISMLSNFSQVNVFSVGLDILVHLCVIQRQECVGL